MPLPFELPFEQVEAELDTCVDEVFSALQSEFLTLPRGEGFIEYPIFEQGYEALKRATHGFRNCTADTMTTAIYQTPVALIVLRAMLGFTPPE